MEGGACQLASTPLALNGGVSAYSAQRLQFHHPCFRQYSIDAFGGGDTICTMSFSAQPGQCGNKTEYAFSESASEFPLPE